MLNTIHFLSLDGFSKQWLFTSTLKILSWQRRNSKDYWNRRIDAPYKKTWSNDPRQLDCLLCTNSMLYSGYNTMYTNTNIVYIFSLITWFDLQFLVNYRTFLSLKLRHSVQIYTGKMVLKTPLITNWSIIDNYVHKTH